MTVITKAIGEKKPADKMEQPLVVDDVPASNGDVDTEAQRPQRGYVGMTIEDQVFILRRPNLRPSCLTFYCLLFTAILGMSIGVIGGLYIYKHYARDQMHRFRTGWYSIPYEGTNRAPIDRDGLMASSQADHFRSLGLTPDQDFMLAKTFDSVNNFFKERFEIDLENFHYEEIDVPDFRGGRECRFIHDFYNNLTGIIDYDGQRCFVMPLNRKRVLPPHIMYDLLRKMYNGYDKVNTEVVRETMRAVFSPIQNRTSVGPYIDPACKHMPIYLLEKVNYTGTVKRDTGDAVFGHYAGENIVEVHIENFGDFVKSDSG